MTYCNETITQNDIDFKCGKEEHKDIYWHKSKPVRFSQPVVEDNQHKFIMLVATWRNEKKE